MALRSWLRQAIFPRIECSDSSFINSARLKPGVYSIVQRHVSHTKCFNAGSEGMNLHDNADWWINLATRVAEVSSSVCTVEQLVVRSSGTHSNLSVGLLHTNCTSMALICSWIHLHNAFPRSRLLHTVEHKYRLRLTPIFSIMILDLISEGVFQPIATSLLRLINRRTSSRTRGSNKVTSMSSQCSTGFAT